MAELQTWIKIPLFLSSYSPLWLIFLISLFVNDVYSAQISIHNFPSSLADYSVIIFSALTIIPIIILVGVLYNTQKGNNPEFITIKEKENSTSEYALYVVTYIIPFLAIDFLEIQKIITLIIVMVTIGSIYIQSNMFHLNPVLTMLRYKLYKISDYNNNKYVLLSKQELKNGEKVKVNTLSPRVYVEVEKNRVI